MQSSTATEWQAVPRSQQQPRYQATIVNTLRHQKSAAVPNLSGSNVLEPRLALKQRITDQPMDHAHEPAPMSKATRRPIRNRQGVMERSSPRPASRTSPDWSARCTVRELETSRARVASARDETLRATTSASLRGRRTEEQSTARGENGARDADREPPHAAQYHRTDTNVSTGFFRSRSEYLPSKDHRDWGPTRGKDPATPTAPSVPEERGSSTGTPRVGKSPRVESVPTSGEAVPTQWPLPRQGRQPASAIWPWAVLRRALSILRSPAQEPRSTSGSESGRV